LELVRAAVAAARLYPQLRELAEPARAVRAAVAAVRHT
jgi:hypothetical protein